MEFAQLVCPLCSGTFQVEIGWQGQQVACPHCGGVVAVPQFPDEVLAMTLQTGATLPSRDASESVSIDTNVSATAEPPADAPTPTAKVRASSLSAVEAMLDKRRLPSETATGSPVVVRDTERQIVTGRGEEVVLCQRTPQDKARRRWRLNVAVALGAALVLAIVFAALLRLR